MFESFDELFNEFFKRNNIKPEDRINGALRGEAEKMIKMLTNFNDFQNIDDAIEKELDETLGKPDKVEFYNEGPIFFEKRIWRTPTGDIVKLISSYDPNLLRKPLVNEKIVSKPTSVEMLKEDMKKAIDAENYELAGEIRDEIKSRETKTKKKHTKKKTK